MFAAGPTLLTTIELEPAAEGTTVHFRSAQPKKAKDRQALQTMGPILNDALRAAPAGRSSPDKFLVAVGPIEFSA